MTKKIAFIGLGHMGNPMVRNLLKSGFHVKVYDVMQEAMQALVKQGAIAATSVLEAVADAEVVFTMLQTGQQVEEVCLGDKGIFAHAKKNLLYIDSSSIDIEVSRALHQTAEKNHIAMVDAPVSGGVAGAEAATLTFMVGGSEENYLRAKSILETLGKKIIHAGSAGNGQAAKICNNLLLAISMIGVCEAFTLAEKLGLASKTFFDISSNASGQCWSMTSYAPVPGLVDKAPANNHYQPGFMAKMMLKDLHLAENAAENAHAFIPLGNAATELYSRFVEQGKGEMDFSAIIKMIGEETR